jgi:hypothetical protein
MTDFSGCTSTSAAIETAATAKPHKALGKNRPKIFPLIGLPASGSEVIRKQF